jgi:electron transfer flavoprotein alpha subunit
MPLSSGTFDAQQPDTARSGEVHTVQWQAPAIVVTRTATQARQSNSVDLDKARLVVSVGRGIGSKENISLAKRCARRLALSWPVPVRWRKTRSGWSTNATSASQPDA